MKFRMMHPPGAKSLQGNADAQHISTANRLSLPEYHDRIQSKTFKQLPFAVVPGAWIALFLVLVFVGQGGIL
jgi:hypothetical protein